MSNNGNIGSLALNLGLADGKDEVGRLGLLGDGEGLSVKDLVLEEDDGVGVTDGGLQAWGRSAMGSVGEEVAIHLEETTAVLGRVRRDDLESGDLSVPGCKRL